MSSEALAGVALQDGSTDLGQSVLARVAPEPDRVPCDPAKQRSVPRLRELPQARDNPTLHAGHRGRSGQLWGQDTLDASALAASDQHLLRGAAIPG